MATLSGNTIASTFGLLLKIDSTGLDGTLREVEDGDATASPLFLSTADVAVDNGSGLIIGSTTVQETVSIGDGSTDLVPELQVLGTAAADSSMLLGAWSTTATTAGAPNLCFVKGGNATIGSHTVVTDGEELGNIIAFGDDGTDLEAPAAMIQFEVDGTPGTGDMPGRIIFATTTDDGETLTERMRIDAAGDMTLTSATASKPILHITNTHAGATAGEIRFNKDSASGDDNDVMGTISWYGTDAGEATHERLAYMDTIITDSAAGSEAASMRFYTAVNDATLVQGLALAGQADAAGEVDVTIGAGAASTTTTAGDLVVGTSTNKVLFAPHSQGQYIHADGNNLIMLCSSNGGVHIQQTGGGGCYWYQNELHPNADDTYDLGNSGERWDDIHATNGTIQTSDQNLKDNITDSSLGLSFLKQLTPREFKFKDYTVPAILYVETDDIPEGKSVGDVKEEERDKTFTRTHYGLIAQEVEQVLSDNGMTTTDFAPIIKSELEDGENRYGMRYTEYVGILIKAVQELSAKVTALENA